MRRKERELSLERALEVIDRADYGTLVYTDAAGAARPVPLSFVRDNGSLYFHCALAGEKVEGLLTHPHVRVCFVTDVRTMPEKFSTAYASVIVTGTAQEVTDPQEKTGALRLICRHYTPNHMEEAEKSIEKQLCRTGVWRIDMDKVSGKANPHP